MKLLRLIAAVILLGGMAFSQASFYSGTAQTTQYINGQQAVKPLPNASIFVCTYPGACTIANAATLYTDATGATTGPNPVTADAFSNFGFWATPGNYQYIITGVNGTSYGPYTASVGGSSSSSGAVPKTSLVANLPVSPTPSQGTIYQALDGQRGQYTYNPSFWHPVSTDINVQDFGARGDGGWYPQVACTSGTRTITNVGHVGGRLPKVGDTIAISGCGAAGADLSVTVSGGTATSGTDFGTVTWTGGATAGATLSNRGARWGVSVDDTAAFTAAITACSTAGQTNGCRIRVPVGVYFVSNVVLPTISGAAQGQIIFQGVGQRASWIIGIGANQTAMMQAPVGSVPSLFSDLGFESYDYNNATQIAVQWLGGLNHTFVNNYVTETYEMVNGRGIQNNLIAFNTCFKTIKHCIEFGASTGGDFVTATLTIFNNFQSWGNAGADSTAHAYYFHTGDSSYSNSVAWNTAQYDNGTPGEPYDVNDFYGDYYLGYQEGSGITSGYIGIFRGQGEVVHVSNVGCMQFTGLNQVVYGAAPVAPCSGQTYAIKNDGTAMQVFGISPALISTPANAVIYGINMQTGGISLKATANSPGTTADWPSGGRVDVTGVPITKSNGASANPDSPTQFGTAATIPQDTVVIRPSPQLGFYTAHLGWLCANNPCAANPIVPSQWLRWGELYTKVHTENAGINSTGVPWQKGDGYWNTTPAPCSLTQPAMAIVTTAGSPGTHTALPLPCPTAVTASLGGGALGAGVCTTGTATVTGATTSMVASASPVTYPGDTIYWKAYVSAADTVTVAVCSATGSTPTASVYNVRVIP